MDKGRYGAKAREARSIGTGKSGSWSDKARNGVEIKGGQRGGQENIDYSRTTKLVSIGGKETHIHRIDAEHYSVGVEFRLSPTDRIWPSRRKRNIGLHHRS